MPLQSKYQKKEWLKRKYNINQDESLTGKPYTKLCEKIIKENTQKIAARVLKKDAKKFDKALQDIKPQIRTKKKIVLPSTADIMRDSPTLIKAATKGKLLTQTLSESIRKTIKNKLVDHDINHKGIRAQRKFLDELKTSIKDEFKSYTVKNPKRANMPTNIHTIAVTESRSAMNAVRHEYVKRIHDTTKDEFDVTKKWIHNSIAETPRESHVKLGRGKPILIYQQFQWTTKDKSKSFTYKADRPHADNLPASETICCSCEVEYGFTPKKKVDRTKFK